MVVYNDPTTVSKYDQLWPDGTLFRPWRNVQSAAALYDANLENLDERPPRSIWGLFGEATPNVFNIVLGVLLLGPGSNYEFTRDVNDPVQQWIRVDFKSYVNLVTDDWYDLTWPTGSTFARDVIGAVYETLGPRVVGAQHFDAPATGLVAE
jgi:hypothetical protein